MPAAAKPGLDRREDGGRPERQRPALLRPAQQLRGRSAAANGVAVGAAQVVWRGFRCHTGGAVAAAAAVLPGAGQAGLGGGAGCHTQLPGIRLEPERSEKVARTLLNQSRTHGESGERLEQCSLLEGVNAMARMI